MALAAVKRHLLLPVGHGPALGDPATTGAPFGPVVPDVLGRGLGGIGDRRAAD